MSTEGVPVNAITSDESGAARTIEIGDTMQNDGVFSVKVNSKNFGLVRLDKQVIALTMAGYSKRETAKMIGIRESALRLHLKTIYDKLGVSNQLELILFATYYHLLDTDETSPPYD
jgi:DNA-binding CsgD family transcriptional regulator